MMGDESNARIRRNLWKEIRGSVSVLLIFIVAAIFLFTSVLIDYARIAAAEWRAEVLAQTGIRSVMSAYEPALQQRYQLFAYGKSDPAFIMDEVMRDQAELKATGVFPWVPVLLDSHTTSITRELGRYDELERQILEEMKYKAPVQFAFDLSSKLKPMSKVMKEAAQTTELLSKLQKLVDKRDKEIASALKLQKSLRNYAARSDLSSRIATGESDIMRDSSLGSIGSAADVGAQYADYVHKIRLDSNRGKDEDKQYENETDDYESDSWDISRRLTSTTSSLLDQHRIGLNTALSHIEKARQYNEDMKRVIQEVRASSNYNGYDRVGQSSEQSEGTMDESDQMSDSIKRINEAADDLVLPDDFLTEWKQEMEEQHRSMEQVNDAVNRFQSMVSQIVGRSISAYNLKTSILSLWRQWEQYAKDYIGSSNVIDAREQRFEQGRSTEKERKQKEKEANRKLGKAADLLSSLKKLNDQLKEHEQLFQEVKEKANAIAAFNEHESSEESAVDQERDDAVEEGKESMDAVTSIYDSIANGFSMLRDRLYRDEYAFLYFNTYDPTKLKSILTSEQSAEELIKSLSIHNQEVEYLLYGLHNPAGNVAAALGEIFAMRLAIRTMEGFIECANLRHPLLILVAAIIYGIEQAVQDLILLATQDKVPISKYLPSVTLSYSDHLRLFMLVHGSREGMLKRMLALIHQNTGIDPTTRGTYGETELRISTPLWFLPGVMKWIGQTGILGGEVENGRYNATKTSVFSY
ncbi:acyl-CoA cholesterol acyltransferase [Paenibacillus sp. MER 180]|uniref:acyl-CoA cholesterol acyltransferase n=1 Tax=unclassified Paenibacillus TaxID=185978 RepID=UPI000AA39288|nr:MULTISPECIES: acyl-CoA cholesterol acyltransferase [unclassified Paenibacillus]MCM3292590.1 acyl-CoA cholesterol acyltransferase [Paenibacillus sp. MER 180]